MDLCGVMLLLISSLFMHCDFNACSTLPALICICSSKVNTNEGFEGSYGYFSAMASDYVAMNGTILLEQRIAAILCLFRFCSAPSQAAGLSNH
jgi:hypothetical protein